MKYREQKVGASGQFLQRRGVKSDMSQRFILAQVLFSLFISDLELGINCKMAKFANDTQLFQVVMSRMDCEKLWKDVSQLEDQVAN